MPASLCTWPATTTWSERSAQTFAAVSCSTPPAPPRAFSSCATPPAWTSTRNGRNSRTALPARDSDFTLFASIPTGGSAFATLQTMLGLERRTPCWMHRRSAFPLCRSGHRPDQGAAGAPAVPWQPAADEAGCRAGGVSRTRNGHEHGGHRLRLLPRAWSCSFVTSWSCSGTPVESVKVIGPASRNGLWLQLKADLLGTPLSVSHFPEVVSRGAQALASTTAVRWETEPAEGRPRRRPPAARCSTTGARTTTLGGST